MESCQVVWGEWRNEWTMQFVPCVQSAIIKFGSYLQCNFSYTLLHSFPWLKTQAEGDGESHNLKLSQNLLIRYCHLPRQYHVILTITTRMRSLTKEYQQSSEPDFQAITSPSAVCRLMLGPGMIYEYYVVLPIAHLRQLPSHKFEKWSYIEAWHTPILVFLFNSSSFVLTRICGMIKKIYLSNHIYQSPLPPLPLHQMFTSHCQSLVSY